MILCVFAATKKGTWFATRLLFQFCHDFPEEPSGKRKNCLSEGKFDMVSLYQKIYGLSSAIYATTFCYLMCQYLLSYIIFQIYLTATVS